MSLVHFNGLETRSSRAPAEFKVYGSPQLTSIFGAAPTLSSDEYARGVQVAGDTGLYTGYIYYPAPNLTSGSMGVRARRDNIRYARFSATLIGLSVDGTLGLSIGVPQTSTDGTPIGVWLGPMSGEPLTSIPGSEDLAWHYYEVVWDENQVQIIVDGDEKFTSSWGGLNVNRIHLTSNFSRSTFAFDDFYVCDNAPGIRGPLGSVVVRHFRPNALNAPDWFSASDGAPALSHLTDSSDSTLIHTNVLGAQAELSFSAASDGAVVAVQAVADVSNSGDLSNGVKFDFVSEADSYTVGQKTVTNISIDGITMHGLTAPDGSPWDVSDLGDLKLIVEVV